MLSLGRSSLYDDPTPRLGGGWYPTPRHRRVILAFTRTFGDIRASLRSIGRFTGHTCDGPHGSYPTRLAPRRIRGRR